MADRAKQVEEPAVAAKGMAQKSNHASQADMSPPLLSHARGMRVPPGLTSPAEILAMQQVVGNRTVMRMLAARRPGSGSSAAGPGSVVQAQLAEDPEEESVQRREEGWREPSDAEIHSAAARGVSTPATTLPYLDRIQASFGRHPVDRIKAHVGSEATEASQAMNALAFASGDHVVFRGTPDLRTAAHEAAHVVQQRAGVQLAGGVGREGDAYERHADAVADAVVAGRPVEGLLEPFAASPLGVPPAQMEDLSHVQRVIIGSDQEQIPPTGKRARGIWNKLRIALIRKGLSPFGAKKVFDERIRQDTGYDTEEDFIDIFLNDALWAAALPKEEREGHGWTRYLKLNRPGWPNAYKELVEEKGLDIRHIVRNATLKDAIVGEWEYQVNTFPEEVAERVMYGIAHQMKIGGGYQTSFEWLKAIYETAYLNFGNLFIGPGAINRVIGLTADPIARIAQDLMSYGEYATPQIISRIFRDLDDIILPVARSMNRLASKMEDQHAEVFLSGFPEWLQEVGMYLGNLNRNLIEHAISRAPQDMFEMTIAPPTMAEIGHTLNEFSANFGFDLPGKSLTRNEMEILINTETRLADYEPGRPEELAEVLGRFMSLAGSDPAAENRGRGRGRKRRGEENRSYSKRHRR